MTGTKKDFYRMISAIALPVALQSVISYGVNLMDTVMLGSLGEIALSSVSLANQLFFIFNVVCLGIGGGAIVLASQYWGKQDTEAIRKVLAISLRFAIVLSIGFAAVIALFPENLMAVFTPEAAVIEGGAGYLRMVAPSYLFYGVTCIFLVVLRSVETVKISLFIYCVSFVVNVVFNYAFIFGKLGAPMLGVNGAAVGTVIARFTELVILVIYAFGFEKKLKFRPRMLFTWDKSLQRDVLHYGMPVILNELLWAVGISVHSVILGHMGSSIVAANSICSVVFQLATSLILGVSDASAVIIGKAVGGQSSDYVRDCAGRLKKLYLAIGVVSAGLLILLKGPIISIYRIEPATKLIAHQLMIAYAFAIFFMAFTCPLIMGVFRGSGDTRFAMLADVGCLWLAIPIGAAAAFWFDMPALIVFACLKLDMPLKACICLWRLKGDQWIWDVTR